MSVAGNGPHHHGPCRYADVARPALCTKSDCPKAWAMGPPTIHHHTPPTQGVQDDEHHSHLAGPRHKATGLLDPILLVSAAVGGDK